MNKITLDKLLFLAGTVIFQISISSVFSSNPQLFIDDYAVIDSSRIVVRYSLEFVANPNKPETIDNDIIVLEIGSKISKSYSYGLYKHDSIATMNKNSAQPFFKARVPPLEVFKNHPIGNNTIVHRSSNHPEPIFIYKDSLDIHWEFLSERKQVAGYDCQEATAFFRGRTWYAWFTNQIPVADGPWKFHGLPGLIMEIYDDQNHFRLTCVGLAHEKVPIKKYNWRYEKTTREKANDYTRWCHENFFDCSKNLGIRLRIIGSSEAETKKMSIPYNPLELE